MSTIQYIETLEQHLTEGETFMGYTYTDGMLRATLSAKRAARIMAQHGAELSELGKARAIYVLAELAMALGY